MNVVINYWAVAAGAVAAMVIGSIWYGPLFGKKYMSSMGMDSWSPEQKERMRKSMYGSYAKQFVASFVTFFVLAWFIEALGNTTLMGGAEVGFWAWLGFVVPLQYSDTLWGGKKDLFWIGIGGQLVTLVVVGAIIGAWH